MTSGSVFGYVTATLASIIIGQDAQETPDTKSLEALKAEVQALRGEIEALPKVSPAQPTSPRSDSSTVSPEHPS
jgi:hypothetical protein